MLSTAGGGTYGAYMGGGISSRGSMHTLFSHTRSPKHTISPFRPQQHGKPSSPQSGNGRKVGRTRGIQEASTVLEAF